MRRSLLPSLLLLGIATACGVDGSSAPAADDPCAVHLEPGADDQVAVQSALLEAAAGSVICFDDGVYHFTDGLSLSVPGITLRSTTGHAILDFSAQAADAPGLDVIADDFTLRGLDLRNTAGDALRLLQTDNVRVLDLRVSWGPDAPPVPGANGIAVVDASNVELGRCAVSGAYDAGIAVTSSDGVIVRSCEVAHSGGGIAVDEASDVILRDVAYEMDPERARRSDAAAEDAVAGPAAAQEDGSLAAPAPAEQPAEQ